MRQRKFWVVLFSLGALAALVVLAVGLNSIDLESRPVYGFRSIEPPPRTTPSSISSEVDTSITNVIGIIFLILTPVAIIYIIISPEARKRFLAQVIFTALLLFGLYMVTRKVQEQAEVVLDANAAMAGEFSEGSADTPMIEPFSSESPDWLVYALSAVVAIILAVVIIRIWIQVQRARQNAKAVEWLVDSAQSAVQEIQAGGDFRSIILRCYYDMTQTAQVKKSIVRADYMTPREFSLKLKSAGLPEEHVQRLTRLFESARYSSHLPTRRQELEAIDCFTAIIDVLGDNA